MSRQPEASENVRKDRWGRVFTDKPRNGIFEAAYRSWFRVEWEGLEHIPKDGGALLVSNHAGMMPIDGGVVQCGIEEELGRRVYSLAHHGFWRFPFAGRFLNQIGGVVGDAIAENMFKALYERFG